MLPKGSLDIRRLNVDFLRSYHAEINFFPEFIFNVMLKSASIKKKSLSSLFKILFFLYGKPLIFLEPLVFWECKEINHLVNVSLTIRPGCITEASYHLREFPGAGRLRDRFSLLCALLSQGSGRSTLESDGALHVPV